MKLRYNTYNKRNYESHALVYSLIDPFSKVLDVGCATGYFGKQLKQKNCKTWGIEIDEKSAEIAKKNLEKVYVEDVKKISKTSLKKHFFDYVLLLDVIEHMTDSEAIFNELKKYLNKKGRIIISTPNIAHITVRIALLFGKFNYTDVGIMDRTHVHFYTRESLLKLLRKTNLKIEKMEYSADFGQIPYLGRFLRHIPKIIQYNITRLFPTLLGVQFIVEVKL